MCRVTGNYTHPRTPLYEYTCVHTVEAPTLVCQLAGNWRGVATVKTRPTHSSCRDSVGLLAPRYMDGFCQPCALLLSSRPRQYTPATLSSLSSLVSATISAWRDYLFHWVSVTLYGGVLSPRGPACTCPSTVFHLLNVADADPWGP